MQRVPMTREGYEKVKAEMEKLEAEKPRILTAIKEAREKGDLSENAEYHAAREELGMLEAKVDQLKTKLALADIVDPSKISNGSVTIGTKVRVFNQMFDEEETYELVGEGEANPRQNRILTTSPIGQALIGKKVGEEGEAKVPAGLMKMRILDIQV
jgi:transcription elongation factor GreA